MEYRIHTNFICCIHRILCGYAIYDLRCASNSSAGGANQALFPALLELPGIGRSTLQTLGASLKCCAPLEHQGTLDGLFTMLYLLISSNMAGWKILDNPT